MLLEISSFDRALYFIIITFTTLTGQRKMGCAFSNEQNLHASLKRIKRAQILHVASLNYCGILKSPFEFYSGQFHFILNQLSQIFQRLKSKYVKTTSQKPFQWQFSKLDKKVKEKRYCPLYNIHAGIVGNKFVSKRVFTKLWHQALQKVEKQQNLQIATADRQEALLFDTLAYHTLLNYVYKVNQIDQMENKDPQLYLSTFQPFFQQAFLDQDKKILKFTQGFERTLTDVIFIQEGNDKLYDILSANPKYHVEMSPDKDTMICLKRDQFKNIIPMRLISIFGQGELSLLDWNNHSAVVIVDKIILISAHLSSNKKLNAQNIETLKKGFKMLRQNHPDYDVICGADLNSYLGGFNDRVHIYPASQQEYTSIKKRTSMQTQSKKSEVLIKESKDAIITTFQILNGEISTISLKKPDKDTFLPENDHPFDHFLVFAQLNIQRLSASRREIHQQ